MPRGRQEAKTKINTKSDNEIKKQQLSRNIINKANNHSLSLFFFGFSWLFFLCSSCFVIGFSLFIFGFQQGKDFQTYSPNSFTLLLTIYYLPVGWGGLLALLTTYNLLLATYYILLLLTTHYYCLQPTITTLGAHLGARVRTLVPAAPGACVCA